MNSTRHSSTGAEMKIIIFLLLIHYHIKVYNIPILPMKKRNKWYYVSTIEAGKNMIGRIRTYGFIRRRRKIISIRNYMYILNGVDVAL